MNFTTRNRRAAVLVPLFMFAMFVPVSVSFKVAGTPIVGAAVACAAQQPCLDWDDPGPCPPEPPEPPEPPPPLTCDSPIFEWACDYCASRVIPHTEWVIACGICSVYAEYCG